MGGSSIGQGSGEKVNRGCGIGQDGREKVHWARWGKFL